MRACTRDFFVSLFRPLSPSPKKGAKHWNRIKSAVVLDFFFVYEYVWIEFKCINVYHIRTSEYILIQLCGTSNESAGRLLFAKNFRGVNGNGNNSRLSNFDLCGGIGKRGKKLTDSNKQKGNMNNRNEQKPKKNITTIINNNKNLHLANKANEYSDVVIYSPPHSIENSNFKTVSHH